mmetsp:Transcript_15469/g.13506  ORF Transcript_15469/g.13506 Transcript_15469/m.13506 type:complete len:196 (-) Transcript_15469:23-610(-)
MVNAIKRRKETKKQHEVLANRIKHLQAVDKKENFEMKKIKTQIDKFNNIRKVKSQYEQKRREVLDYQKKEQDVKYKAAQMFKQQIQESIRIKREELLIKNKLIMEEVMREQDQAKMKKKKIQKDINKSEYRNRIAREKLEANSYNRKVQDLERVESDLVDKLENTQDIRRNIQESYKSLVYTQNEEDEEPIPFEH